MKFLLVVARRLWHPVYKASRPLVRKYNNYRIGLVSESELISQQKNLFNELGLDWTRAHNRVVELVGPHVDLKSHRSQHYELFAAIAQQKDPRRILEIGTADGSFTVFLAQCFPSSTILTVDLPADHRRFWNATYENNGDGVLETSQNLEQSAEVKMRNEILSTSSNIIFRELNSLELSQLEGESYDIIWVDGDHTFPIVACDITNAIRLLAPDGFMCCDDIRLAGRLGKEKWGSDESLEVLNVFNFANLIKTSFVLKSIRPEKNFSPRIKKHIAISTLAS